MGADSQAGQSEVLREPLDVLAHEVLSLAEVIAMPQSEDPRLLDQQHFISPDPASTAHFDGRHFGGALAHLPDGLTKAAFAHVETDVAGSAIEEAYVGWEAQDGERWTVNVRYDNATASFVTEASWQEYAGPIRKHTNDWMARMALLYARALAGDIGGSA